MQQINKICISRLDKMGDMILSLPAIESIKISNPTTKIYILASKNNEKVLKNLNYIDEKIIIDTSQLSINNISKIRKFNFDYFINLSPTFLSYFYCFFSNSKKKATLIFKSRYKQNKLSRALTVFFSKIFCQYIYTVERYSKLKNNEEIHQTKMIYNLIKICKIPFNINNNTNISLPKEKINLKKINKSLITIHLSERWINNYYNEEDFLKLLFLLPKEKYIYFLTTDNTSKNKFKKIFNNYKIIHSQKFATNNVFEENIIILDKLEYQDWLKVIYSSKKVITPECGCTHISAACKVPVIIIYDSDNLPEAIYKEYHPWESKHYKLVFNDNNLNTNIIKKLN